MMLLIITIILPVTNTRAAEQGLEYSTTFTPAELSKAAVECLGKIIASKAITFGFVTALTGVAGIAAAGNPLIESLIFAAGGGGATKELGEWLFEMTASCQGKGLKPFGKGGPEKGIVFHPKTFRALPGVTKWFPLP